MTYECAPSCGLTFDEVAEYLRHVAQCPRVLPGVAETIAKMHRVPAPAKKSCGPRAGERRARAA